MVDSTLMGKRGWCIAIQMTMAAGILSGCVGTPTYGTGKPADQQLLEDVTGILTISPKRTDTIDYKPRPEIVKPATAEVLPPPVEANTTANPSWPESPEQRLARLRTEATENRDKPGYRPKVKDSSGQDLPSPAIFDRNAVATAPAELEGDGAGASRGLPKQNSAASYDRTPIYVENTSSNQREEFNRRLAASRQGSPDNRNYLSEPPVEYRVPAETAAKNDIGEDEWRKEKRLKAESRKKAGKTSWRDLVPWL